VIDGIGSCVKLGEIGMPRMCRNLVLCPSTDAPPGGTLLAVRRRLVQRQLCPLHWMVARDVSWSELE